MTDPLPGQIAWRDLTVPDATSVRDFYAAVVGWTSEDHSMGDYADYSMKAADGQTVAGICHARGTNAAIPPQWLVYITVDDIERAAAEATARGGRILDGPRPMGGSQFCVIEDPAGAVAALITAPTGNG